MRHEDIPDINNPKTMNPVLEGDKLMKEVLNGGYNVHPVPPPNSEIKERITKRYERERIKIEKLFTLGYTTSGDPFWTRTRWNLSEEDKDMIVNEISLVIQNKNSLARKLTAGALFLFFQELVGNRFSRNNRVTPSVSL